MKITYLFTSAPLAREWSFEIETERAAQPEGKPEAPAWTKLDFCKCKPCTLDSSTNEFCPAAFDLRDVITQFGSLRSFDKVTVRVQTPQRMYQKDVDLQTGIQSLMGLVMASSGCPILSHFKGLVYYHIPFVTVEENLFRVVGFYLLKQYYLHQRGRPMDLDLKHLSEIYADAAIVNSDFSERITAASSKEANLGAVANWSCVSMLMSGSLKDLLEQYSHLFVESTSH